MQFNYINIIMEKFDVNQPKIKLRLKQPQQKIKLSLKKKTYCDWIIALTSGNYEQILECMKTFDINQPSIVYPSPRESIIYPSPSTTTYPMHILYDRGHLETMYRLMTNKTINLNLTVLGGYGVGNLLQLLTYSIHYKGDMCLKIARELLSHSDFIPTSITPCPLFNVLSSNPSGQEYEFFKYLIGHPRIDVNQTYIIYRDSFKGCLGSLLSHQLATEQSENIMNMVRVLLSRADVIIEKISDPHPLMLPYIKFYIIKQRIITHHKNLRIKLSKPPYWSAWQKIAHNLQTPPLLNNDKQQLFSYAHMINDNITITTPPISMCVALSNHYEQYHSTLNYHHDKHPINDTDLLGNLFSGMPSEYIIIDDDKYGFNISEISKVIELKRHPYTGKNWVNVTIDNVPFIDYIRQNPINPIHLMHQMMPVVEEPPIHPNQKATERLMEYYRYTTYDICQIYAENLRCRVELLKNLHMIAESPTSPTYPEFVEMLIDYIMSYPTNIRNYIRQKVYQSLEICQVYV